MQYKRIMGGLRIRRYLRTREEEFELLVRNHEKLVNFVAKI
jgi:hypothetical protein